jgi:hypothetical protein
MVLLNEQAATVPETWADVPLIDSGPLRRLARRIGRGDDAAGLARLALGIALLTWVPLVPLAAIDGVLTSGSTVPFLESVGTHVRLLLAIPLFFVAELAFGRRVREVVCTLVDSHVVPSQQLPILKRMLLRTKQWLDAPAIEAAIVALTIYLIVEGVRGDLPSQISTWRQTAAGGPTLAGWYYSLISLPVFQFLVWRWVARLLVWCHFLWQMGRLHLHLMPAHPDQAGGLGGLGVAHVALAPLGFALSAIMVGTYAEEVMYGGLPIQRLVQPIAFIVVANAVSAVVPLLVFTPALVAAKRHGLLQYGRLAAEYTRAFDAKWVSPAAAPKEQLLGSADLQSLADLANAFDVIRQMRVVPIRGRQTLILAVAAALPALPLVLLVIPLDELVLRFVRTIINI